jgi:hypothetical protein
MLGVKWDLGFKLRLKKHGAVLWIGLKWLKIKSSAHGEKI